MTRDELVEILQALPSNAKIKMEMYSELDFGDSVDVSIAVIPIFSFGENAIILTGYKCPELNSLGETVPPSERESFFPRSRTLQHPDILDPYQPFDLLPSEFE